MSVQLLFGGWWTAGDDKQNGLDELEGFFKSLSPPWIVDPANPQTSTAGLWTTGAKKVGAKDAAKEMGWYRALARVQYFGAWPVVAAAIKV